MIGNRAESRSSVEDSSHINPITGGVVPVRHNHGTTMRRNNSRVNSNMLSEPLANDGPKSLWSGWRERPASGSLDSPE